jgi:PAP2 superfamily
MFFSMLSIPAISQTTLGNSSSESGMTLPDAPEPTVQHEAIGLRNVPINIVRDQAAIWTSPLRIRTSDLKWLIPLAAATGVSLGTDSYTMKSVVSQNPSFNQANVNTSNVLEGGILIAPVAFYGLGRLNGNEHSRETGILGGEAILDSLVVEQGLKLMTWRERPEQNNARGLFWQGSAGANSSFPSTHSTLAWSSAAVIASEYPSHLTQFGVYTVATAISLTRVLGQQHFPTDVLVGSAAGWLIGRYVYRKHHQFDPHQYRRPVTTDALERPASTPQPH